MSCESKSTVTPYETSAFLSAILLGSVGVLCSVKCVVMLEYQYPTLYQTARGIIQMPSPSSQHSLPPEVPVLPPLPGQLRGPDAAEEIFALVLVLGVKLIVIIFIDPFSILSFILPLISILDHPLGF
jgi:hypothetical protein